MIVVNVFRLWIEQPPLAVTTILPTPQGQEFYAAGR